MVKVWSSRFHFDTEIIYLCVFFCPFFFADTLTPCVPIKNEFEGEGEEEEEGK